jgi:hypothetical protein
MVINQTIPLTNDRWFVEREVITIPDTQKQFAGREQVSRVSHLQHEGCCYPVTMSAEDFVNMLEEMIDLKVQQRTQINLRTTPEIARVLQDKQETDRRRLAQLKVQLVQLLSQ